MAKTCCDLVKEYKQLLCSKVFAERNDFGCTIYTAVLGPDNDPYRIYVEDLGGDRFKITDYGNTLYELERVELDYTTERKDAIISRIKKRTGVNLNERSNSLEVVCTYDRIPASIDQVLQAIVEITYLQYLSTSETEYEFNVIVHDFLAEHDIHPYFERRGIRVPFMDMRLTFDMQMGQASDDEYGTLIQTLHVENRENSLRKSRDKTSNFMMLRLAQKKFVGVAIVDELDGMWTNTAKSWLSRSCDKVLNWSEKDEILDYMRPLSK